MSTSTVETTACEICKKTIPLEPELMYAGRYYCPEDFHKKTGKHPYPQKVAGPKRRPEIESRYGFTRLLMFVFRLVAVFGIVGSIILSTQASANLTYGMDTTLMLIAGILGGVVLLATAEGLQVVLDEILSNVVDWG